MTDTNTTENTTKLDLQFNKSIKDIKEIKELSNVNKLKLYGYYKQATVGNNETPKPSIFSFKESSITV